MGLALGLIRGATSEAGVWLGEVLGSSLVFEIMTGLGRSYDWE